MKVRGQTTTGSSHLERIRMTSLRHKKGKRSGHPRWSLCAVSLLLLAAACASKEESATEPVVSVRMARAEKADIRLSVQAPATLYPKRQARVAARITAPIRKLHARQGDYVAKSRLLAELENADLLAQRKEALAIIADAAANLKKMSAGTLPTDVQQARGRVATAEAALRQAKTIFEKRERLFQQGAIPNRSLLVSQTELAQAQTAFDVSTKSLELLLNQSRESDIQIAQSRLDQARARLELLDAQIQFTRILSPFAGTIVRQFLYPGDMAKPDAPIFTLMDFSVAVARAQVPEVEVAAIRIGQESRFAPADGNESGYEGRVSVISRTVDPASRTVEVWGEILNPVHSLRAGMFGTLTLFTGEVPGSILVPLSAVQVVEGTKQGFVMVVDDSMRAHRRDVTVGETIQGKVRITAGIDAGESVIVEGGYGLPEGTAVSFAREKTP